MTGSYTIRTDHGGTTTPGHRVPTARILVLETLLLAAVLTTFRSVALAVALTAALTVAAVMWLAEPWWRRRAVARRFRTRVRAVAPAGDDPMLRAIRAFGPRLNVQDALHRGAVVGVADDGDGWFAAIEAAPLRGLDGWRQGDLPLGHLTGLVTTARLPVSAVQVVTTSVPAPAPGGGPCFDSYRQLLGPLAVAAEHCTLVVVRFDLADALAAAAARGGGIAGLHRALSAALGRAGAALSDVGCAFRRLDSAGLAACLADSLFPLGVDIGTADRVAEQWTLWQGGDLALRTWRLTGWPVLGTAGLHDRLAAVGAASIATSVTISRGAGGPAVTGLIRVAAPHDALRTVGARVVEVVGGCGGRLEPLDGRHSAAAYAAAPTGAVVG
jgi:type VII secretion protein EccE